MPGDLFLHVLGNNEVDWSRPAYKEEMELANTSRECDPRNVRVNRGCSCNAIWGIMKEQQIIRCERYSKNCKSPLKNMLWTAMRATL